MRSSFALTLQLGSVALGGGLLVLATLGFPEVRLVAAGGGVAVLVGGALLAARLRAHLRRVEDLAKVAERLADGDVHHFAPAYGDGVQARLAIAVNRIGDRLRGEHLATEEQRALERAMVRESPNGLLVVDSAGRVRSVNPALHQLLPVHKDPVGCAPIEAIPLAELQEVIDEAARTRAPAERSASVGQRDLLVRGVPLADGAGVLGVVLDVTSVRRAERVRRDFVANVSHELRTPITAIVGYAEALADESGRLPPDLVPMVDAVHRNAERLGALVADVLHLSRIEARQSDLPLEPEPLAPFVADVIERFARRAEQKGVALVAGRVDTVEALVNGEALEHVLNNLVDNALKYTPAGGRVTLSAVREVGGVRLDVADTGVGIDPVHHERIFERFYRVDEGRDRSAGGTGLGLALVKHICRATRSEVSLTSAPGAGTRFTLKLPLA